MAAHSITTSSAQETPPPAKKIWWKSLYLQVVLAIFIGAAVGHFEPDTAIALKPLGDAFIKLIKMLVGPIIFCTVVTGIASMDNISQAGRVGIKAMLYFFILSALSLAVGLVIANVFEPGVGMNIDANTLDQSAINQYVNTANQPQSVQDFFLHLIPTTVVDAFAKGEILQVLFFALLFAAATIFMGERAKPIVKLIDDFSHVLFTIVGIIMKVAPLGALGAMAYTVGQYGLASMIPLAKLLLCYYATCLIFVFAVCGIVLRMCELSLLKFLRYIKEEIFIVFGTCSSETVFPRMVEKLTVMGCDKSIVGMVLPTGYSFNLSGTAIYLTMAAIFLAQATNTPMTLQEELVLLGVMMLTSKGAAGVVGTAFVVLSATLSSIGHIPVAAVTIILGIDRFMAEGRAVTNLISNGAATLLVAKWEKSLDLNKARAVLNREIIPVLETSSKVGKQMSLKV
ncbi:MAG: C4-dicarboxylate transporter DctA [Rickettsiales bacterium]|nr:C4-dicarboxylate transporter DctA [Rickettsiales bacterium]